MKGEDRLQYVKYRISRADETFDAAKLLGKNGYWNSAVNRLYYSAFYAVGALLTLNGIKSKSHSSTRSLFSLHFVKTGKLPKKHGRFFSELYDLRQKGDYDNIEDYKEEFVSPLFDSVEDFISTIKELISKQSQI